MLFRSDTQHNQTTFSQDAPILDMGLEDAQKLKYQREQALKPKLVWFKRPKVIILLSLIVLSLLIGLIILANTMMPQAEPPVAIEPTPTVMPYKEDLSLSEQIKSHKLEFKKLDFQEANLAFPQVDRDIAIEINQ